MDMTGVTDRENICSAFAQAVAAGPGSIVELTAGEFVTDRPIQIADFDGVFRGAGMEDTLVRTAGIDPFPNAPPIQGVPIGPSMFMFYQMNKGDCPATATEIAISDMILQTIGPPNSGVDITSRVSFGSREGLVLMENRCGAM